MCVLAVRLTKENTLGWRFVLYMTRLWVISQGFMGSWRFLPLFNNTEGEPALEHRLLHSFVLLNEWWVQHTRLHLLSWEQRQAAATLTSLFTDEPLVLFVPRRTAWTLTEEWLLRHYLRIRKKCQPKLWDKKVEPGGNIWICVSHTVWCNFALAVSLTLIWCYQFLPPL